MPSHQSLDNVLVAFETLHKLKSHQKGSETLIVLKLDMNKAYDKVEWSFFRSFDGLYGF